MGPNWGSLQVYVSRSVVSAHVYTCHNKVEIVASETFLSNIDLMSLAKHFGQGIQYSPYEISLKTWNAQGFS